MGSVSAVTNGGIKVDVSHVGRLAVTTIRGELDIGSADELSAALNEVMAQQDVVVDLSAVDFVDSSGLAVLLRAPARVGARGRKAKTPLDAETDQVVVECFRPPRGGAKHSTEVCLAEVDGNRTRQTRVARLGRFEGGGAHQVPRHLRLRRYPKDHGDSVGMTHSRR